MYTTLTLETLLSTESFFWVISIKKEVCTYSFDTLFKVIIQYGGSNPTYRPINACYTSISCSEQIGSEIPVRWVSLCFNERSGTQQGSGEPSVAYTGVI